MSTDQADNEIRARLKANDLTALDMIWDQYAMNLFGYLISILCSKHDAEDVLQDVFVTIARKRKSVAQARLLKPYLFRLSRNVALNRLKRNKRVQEKVQELSGWLEPEETNELHSEQTQKIEAALANLPEKQRTVLVLKFYQNKTLREISEFLGISQNTAGSRYRYGMDNLRTNLQEGLL